MEPLPEKPRDTDCCGSGCTPCVFDAYERMLSQCTRPIRASSPRRIRHDLLCPLKYKPYKLVSTTPLNNNTTLYCVVPASDDLDGALPYDPGQHFIMIDVKSSRTAGANASSPPCSNIINECSISRPYTPISVSDDARCCAIQFFVKFYENGRMSSFLKDLLPSVDVIYLRGAFGHFKHEFNSKYLMICAGTGIAPMYSIVKSVLKNERDDSLIRLCWACATLDDVVFRNEIREFSKYWNFNATIYLSKETEASIGNAVNYGEDIRAERISLRVVRELVAGNRDYKLLVCGSEKFSEDISMYARECDCEQVFVFR